MKKIFKTTFALLLTVGLIFLSACNPVEDSMGTPPEEEMETPQYKYKDIVPPSIPSDDRVMSVFFDITYYNVENYAEIYLGKDYKITGKFDGIKLEAPSDYNTLIKNGFVLADNADNNGVDGDSIVYAGYKNTLTFKSPNGYNLDAVFYNDQAQSKKLSECTLVKYECKNDSNNPETIKSLLSVNEISFASSLSEVITKLGYPSHFHKEDDNLYSLDYFLDKDDLRDRITVFAYPAEDSVTSISFCKYTK